MILNGIASNCGIITPQFFKTCDFGGQPNVTQNHIPYFNSMMCQLAYNIPNKFSWVMVINAHNRNFLLNKIKSTLPQYEPPGWNIKSHADATWTNATQDVIGCIFAQGVRIPGERVNIDYSGISEGSNRGFINSPIINGRSNFEPLGTGFLETNKSFVDGILRPWSIVVAHEGLIARPRERSIKSDIFIYQLAKNGECSPNIIRKAYIFKDCVPITIPNEDLTYANDGDYPKMQVDFVYSSYYIDSFDSGGSSTFASASNNNGLIAPNQVQSSNNFDQITMSQQAVREQINLARNLV